MYKDIKNATRNNEYRRVIIQEVNTQQYYIVGRDSHDAALRINFDLQSPVVSIPAPGEMWNIKRSSTGEWLLDKKLESGAELHPIDALAPGDRRIETTGLVYIQGDDVVINGYLFSQIPTDIAAMGAELSADIAALDAEFSADIADLQAEVDAIVPSLDPSTIVRTTGTQTISGTKNFTGGIQVNGVALAASHLSNSTTGSGAVVLATGATLTTPTITTPSISDAALTGVPTAPTAAVGTNTTQVATTAFYISQGANSLPASDGIAAIGISNRYARQDHVHPTDTTRQALDATLTALSSYNTNGLLTQTAADTFAGRTITGTAGQITVTNGDGVAGNPTVSLPATITQTTTFSNDLTVSGNLTVVGSLIGGIPPGVILPYGGSAAPTSDWLLCNGALVSRTTYANLYAVIGFSYSPTPGADPGSNNFYLPNMLGRVAVGLDAGQAEFDTRGESGGAKTVNISHTHSTPDHSHGITSTPNYSAIGPVAGGGADFAIGSGTLSVSSSMGSGGGGTSGAMSANSTHSVLQPYLTVNYIIKI